MTQSHHQAAFQRAFFNHPSSPSGPRPHQVKRTTQASVMTASQHRNPGGSHENSTAEASILSTFLCQEIGEPLIRVAKQTNNYDKRSIITKYSITISDLTVPNSCHLSSYKKSYFATLKAGSLELINAALHCIASQKVQK